MCAVGKPPRRRKAATLATLKNDLGKERIGHIDRAMLIEYDRKRAAKGAGPMTLGIDIGVIKMIITHAAAVHRLDISSEPVDLARIALKRLCYPNRAWASRIASVMAAGRYAHLGPCDVQDHDLVGL